MMDRIVPGGVAADLAAGGATAVRALARRSPARLPAARRSLRQHRLAAGPHRRHRHAAATALARQFGAGGYVGRASGRDFDARRDAAPMRPTTSSTFDVPVLDAGDVNARVWIRIREVEQSLSLIEQILRAACRTAPIRAPRPSVGARARRRRRWSKASAATCWSGCGSTGRPHRALPPARSVLVPVAAARSRDRGQHRRRLPALQQILQLLLLGPRPLGDPRCARLLFESLDPTAADRAAPARRRRGAGRARPGLDARRAPPARPQPVDPRRSMPAPATAASSKSTRSTTRSTTSNASACASSPRRATPTC